MVVKKHLSIWETPAFMDKLSKEVRVAPFEPVHIHLVGLGIDFLSDLMMDFDDVPSNVIVKCELGSSWPKDVNGNHIIGAQYILDTPIDEFLASLDASDPQTARTIVITEDQD
ncbi:hypothetical protein K4K58_009157 [Colletotrichum sp. SAR11_239]|nr:hypothetical protein K4K58_009157 [Colletotrichum sp. SAR11_239]